MWEHLAAPTGLRTGGHEFRSNDRRSSFAMSSAARSSLSGRSGPVGSLMRPRPPPELRPPRGRPSPLAGADVGLITDAGSNLGCGTEQGSDDAQLRRTVSVPDRARYGFRQHRALT